METITAFTRNDFRKWLKKNHKKEKNVSVVLHKRHTGKPAPTHRELMEEAICFGWIDTTIHRVDENKYLRKFTKRNNNSKWSYNTLSYARKLIEENKMVEEGMKFYKLGLEKPTHDHGIPKNPKIPFELKKELNKNKVFKDNFDKFPKSIKKMLYKWIIRAKLPETKRKRILKIIENLRKGNKNFMQ